MLHNNNISARRKQANRTDRDKSNMRMQGKQTMLTNVCGWSLAFGWTEGAWKAGDVLLPLIYRMASSGYTTIIWLL